MKLREEVSKIIGLRVESGHWDEAFQNLDTTGRFNQRVILGLILLILKKLDESESI